MKGLVLTLVLVALPGLTAAQDTTILTADTSPDTAPPAEVAPPAAPALQILDAADLDLAQFQWTARIVAVLATSPNDPAFVQQMRYLQAGADRLIDRDVVVVTDTDPRSNSPLRRLLRARGFMLAIIEKDGAVTQRRPAPRDVREIAAIIDRFPLRRQEVLERLPSGN